MNEEMKSERKHREAKGKKRNENEKNRKKKQSRPDMMFDDNDVRMVVAKQARKWGKEK